MTDTSTTTNVRIDRHAAAIAEIEAMSDLIHTQKIQIEMLQRDVQTERDRVALLTEETTRWRTDAMACRTFVTKLATIQEIINQATIGSKMILDDMAAMDSTETSKEAINETTKTIEENLAKIKKATNDENMNGTSVPPVQEGASSHS